MRAAWGCDAPTAGAQLLIPCVACGGEGAESCDTCSGVGYEAIFRCPWSEDVGEAVAALWVRAQYPGALPCAGGLLEQPGAFVDLLRLASSAEARLEPAKEASVDGD